MFGKDLTHEPIAGRGVSMVFQSFALYPHLTVYENFAYPLAKTRSRRPRSTKRVNETAAMLQLRIGSSASPAPCPAASSSASRSAVR